MKELKNWKIERSGGGMKITHDQRSYPDYGKLTRVKLVEIRDGKIIATQDNTGKGYENREFELLVPIRSPEVEPGVSAPNPEDQVPTPQ